MSAASQARPPHSNSYSGQMQSRLDDPSVLASTGYVRYSSRPLAILVVRVRLSVYLACRPKKIYPQATYLMPGCKLQSQVASHKCPAQTAHLPLCLPGCLLAPS